MCASFNVFTITKLRLIIYSHYMVYMYVIQNTAVQLCYAVSKVST